MVEEELIDRNFVNLCDLVASWLIFLGAGKC